MIPPLLQSIKVPSNKLHSHAVAATAPWDANASAGNFAQEQIAALTGAAFAFHLRLHKILPKSILQSVQDVGTAALLA